jgi:acetyl esterase/lipase
MLKKSRPGVLSPDLTESRKQFFEMFDALAKLREPHAGAENVVSEDVLVDQHVRVRVYIPPTRDIRQQKPPLGLYIHSGGWFTGSIDAEDFLCRIIALESQMILFSPEYRLAPENPFPEGLKDCLAVYEYMHNQGAYYGGDPSKKFIMGGSAGGNLTACVGLNYASNANLRPTGMIVACMTSCDPRALPSEYKKRHLPNNYMDTPMINSKSIQTARGEALYPGKCFWIFELTELRLVKRAETRRSPLFPPTPS